MHACGSIHPWELLSHGACPVQAVYLNFVKAQLVGIAQERPLLIGGAAGRMLQLQWHCQGALQSTRVGQNPAIHTVLVVVHNVEETYTSVWVLNTTGTQHNKCSTITIHPSGNIDMGNIDMSAPSCIPLAMQCSMHHPQLIAAASSHTADALHLLLKAHPLGYYTHSAIPAHGGALVPAIHRVHCLHLPIVDWRGLQSNGGPLARHQHLLARHFSH